jgi:uncharacterized membrane protein
MIAVLLAALGGLSYGGSDFFGAVASKRFPAALVTMAVQAVSLVALVVVLVVFPPEQWRISDLLWGALGGIGGGVALTLFYEALARGPMSTAASLTGLVGATVPVLAGLGLGDRPSALAFVGIVLSIPAVVLVSSSAQEAHGAAVIGPRERVAQSAHIAKTRQLAFVAGLGFGLFFVALSRVSSDAGLTPLVGARLASIVLIGAVVSQRSAWQTIGRASWGSIALAGLLDFAANALYLLALDEGLFTWVVALVSLYPVSTVLLARFVLGEHLSARQAAGLGLAAGALVLVAVGR